MIKNDCLNTNIEAVLKEIIQYLKEKKMITNDKQILNKLLEREKLGSTSIGNHAAVPHTKIKGLKEPILFIAILKKGIQYHDKDKELVHLVILILSPNDTPIIHLQILAAAASLIKKSNTLIEELVSNTNSEELINIIKKYEIKDE
ncbi:MAG: PTS sugar transporter subunit IIA [Candidatus Aminicenantes bacterium]|nr:PTS sugar transporter subunit IIA [Candidatus Aminicenantes bacterium]